MKRVAKAVAVATMVMVAGTTGAKAKSIAEISKVLQVGMKSGILVDQDHYTEKYFGFYLETKPKYLLKGVGVSAGVEITDGFLNVDDTYYDPTSGEDVRFRGQYEKTAGVLYLRITLPNRKTYFVVGKGKLDGRGVTANEYDYGYKFDMDGDRLVLGVGFKLTDKVDITVRRVIDDYEISFDDGVSKVDDTWKAWGLEIGYAF